jgi:hypothetical protein
MAPKLAEIGPAVRLSRRLDRAVWGCTAARVLAALNHPNIADIHGLADADMRVA